MTGCGLLGGAETVVAAFVATGWRHRRVSAVLGGGASVSWGQLLDDVRHLTLGLLEGGSPGRVVGIRAPEGPGALAAALAVLGCGSVLALDGDADETISSAALAGLRERGAAFDASRPDAFERSWRGLRGDAGAVAEGGCRFTHDNLLVAAHGLVATLGIDAGDRLRVHDLGSRTAVLVAAGLVPAITGATALLGDHPADALATVELRGEAALVVPGHAGVAVLDGRPLPGVTVAVGDDGELLVRSDATAPGRRTDGWLRTGRRGAVVDGRVHVEPAA